jgi:NDP-sugar pyrophosphorylase family protein
MRREQVGQMPILDSRGAVVDLVLAGEIFNPDPGKHAVVIMAGGLGTRLRPITESIPKPMVPIGGRPVLELIIEQFATQGFRWITLCVNHLAEVIEDHFGDGKAFGVEIEYVREAKRMGTAGALSLVSPAPAKPVIVMNGDILTALNFSQLLTFHYDNGALATMGVNHFQYQIPYGVVDIRNHQIHGFVEKPIYDFFVNAGLYVVSPQVLDCVPEDEFFDMPSLFDQLEPSQKMAFPIHEYWLDIGKHDDLDRASREYETFFGARSSR